MKGKKTLAAIAVLAFAPSVFLPVSVSAQQQNNPVDTIQQNRQDLQEDIQNAKEDAQEARQQNVEQRCEIATSRIDTITQKYEQNRLRYVNRYNNLIQRLENLVEFLQTKEIDPAGLPAQIEQIRVMTQEFNNLMQQTMNAANETKTLACGESEGAYLNKLQESRQYLLQARAEAVEINNYFVTNVVPELEAIKSANR